MSRLSELIRDLCPDGVEYRALGEVAYIRTGSPVSKNFIQSHPGPYPVYNSGRKPFGYVDQYNVEDDPIGITSRGAGVGSVSWCEGKYYRGPLNYSVTIRDSCLVDARYLYHYLLFSTRELRRLCSLQGIPALNKSKLQRMAIAVPPPGVQQEIVRILDQFTTLEAELEAELEARKAQYGYYRDSLFARRSRDFRVEAQWVPLGELGEFIRGNGLQKSEFVQEGQPAIHYGQIHTTFGVRADRAAVCVAQDKFDSLKKALPGDLLIATTSEDDDAVAKAVAWVGSGPVAVSGDMYIYRSGADNRYMSHFFASRCFQRQKRPYVTGTKVRRISAAGLSKVLVPLVDRNDQRRIADILDRFDTLVNDISSGLPAEIAARHEQYEYYRNMVLTFPERRR